MAFSLDALSHTATTKKDEELKPQGGGEEEEPERGASVKYVPLCDLYSSTSPCGSSNIMSKKVKARKLEGPGPRPTKPPIIRFYYRRRKRPYLTAPPPPVVVKIEQEELEDLPKKKRRKIGCTELINLGADLVRLDGPRLRETPVRRNVANGHKTSNCNSKSNSRQPRSSSNAVQADNSSTKRWVSLSFNGVDPKKLIGLKCKVYWPLDADWYCGRVVGYDPQIDRHHVKYEDGDEENVKLSNERIKFSISSEEMQRLKLSYGAHCSETGGLDVDEMVVLAASLDDCHELEPGDIIWAKLTGHAVWPAIVLDECLVGNRKGLNKVSGEKSVPVQFFGTHDFARVKAKQVISFLRGLLSYNHLKCKKSDFVRSLEEAKVYLSEQRLPERMLHLRNRSQAYRNGASLDTEGVGDERLWSNSDGLRRCPFEIGDLQVLSLGKIVKDSDYFQDQRSRWPQGYTALRRFPSLTDPSLCSSYKMEVLRDPESKERFLFRVTADKGERFEGSTPSACWNKVYRRMRKKQFCSSDASMAEGASERVFKSGSDMFGFSHPEVLKLIQESSYSQSPSKSSKLTFARHQGLPVGYRPVHVEWKDLDKCNVCHMDEEYENNLFLQCDKCRMMVHARCYGELEPLNGILWFCNLCRSGAPEFPPPCCLCPVIGGAMKPTTDGRWAHLACAIWIPETCLSDIKKMEPIDGLSRISKDRWKLLCSICGVSYGACIQCSKSTCYVAYHPLCARAAGFCAELEDEDRMHLIPLDEDEENQCIRLLSFCKKHRPASTERPLADERISQVSSQYSAYVPPANPSGCARSEPYNYLGRRGRKEPEALAAASLKRSFVENRPYVVGGYCQNKPLGNTLLSSTIAVPNLSLGMEKLEISQLDASRSIVCMAEKYIYMRKTFRKRLAFGKSAIHGFGIFAKQPHRAGDMVIEYTGELVRPSIADRREHLIYNSLVGAGTYMFRIDDERVIDATRAGSIAHLINHSCEPNCYSRVISVNGDEHIIIFAKRDIKQWEELTYDYRFFSIDEQLACSCGFPRCRGVVNDIEAEELVAKLYAPRSELVDWRGE